MARLAAQDADAIVAVYLKAYQATVQDPEYKATIAKTDPGSPQVDKADLERVVRELSKVSPEVINYIQGELKRQGFNVESK